MASVQPAAMQQPTLPPNLTQQQIQAAYEKYKLLKTQKTPNNDPELLKLQHFLTLVKQQQHMRQLAAQKQQQMQQAKAQVPPLPPQQPPVMNGQTNGAVANGAKPVSGQMDGVLQDANGAPNAAV